MSTANGRNTRPNNPYRIPPTLPACKMPTLLISTVTDFLQLRSEGCRWIEYGYHRRDRDIVAGASAGPGAFGRRGGDGGSGTGLSAAAGTVLGTLRAAVLSQGTGPQRPDRGGRVAQRAGTQDGRAHCPGAWRAPQTDS